jgi:hypothetical protein
LHFHQVPCHTGEVHVHRSAADVERKAMQPTVSRTARHAAHVCKCMPIILACRVVMCTKRWFSLSCQAWTLAALSGKGGWYNKKSDSACSMGCIALQPRKCRRCSVNRMCCCADILEQTPCCHVAVMYGLIAHTVQTGGVVPRIQGKQTARCLYEKQRCTLERASYHVCEYREVPLLSILETSFATLGFSATFSTLTGGRTI